MTTNPPRHTPEPRMTIGCADLICRTVQKMPPLEPMLETLDGLGALSFPFLPEKLRLELLEEAEGMTYVALPREGGNGVVQEIEAARDIRPCGPLWYFTMALSRGLGSRLSALDPYPFRSKYDPNDITVQRYHPGTIGITPHVDGRSHRNIVALVILGGHGDFNVCADRAGSDPTPIDMSPGNLFLMRANGFRAHENTPFHYVTDIRDERHVLGIRHKQKL